ncbi:hypothetical protein J1614_000670 [Plenodomus biglobosus]|nr:hypothetical protein J1614_000670 [Plenodomus biglobosus]
MPDSATHPSGPSDPLPTPSRPQPSSAPRAPDHHGQGSSGAGANARPRTLTPATATATATAAATTTSTRQSLPLGALSTRWGDNTTPAPTAQPVLSDDTVPAIFTHAPSCDAQGGPSDLTASTDSVPSTATTLTNTLPPTQSAALRALNAPAFHSSPSKTKSAKSSSSRTTVTSQPVVVRTYSASRHASRSGSGFSTPRSFTMNGHKNVSALSAGLAGKSEQLPAADDFSFSAILRAVDPEIRDAIDAIAEICARSRLSMADEYDAHLPPQGEITSGGPGWAASTGALVGRGRLNRVSQGWTAADNTLMAVPEASSSSERLAQESKNISSKKRSQSAYGSLKSVISGSSGKRKALDGDTFRDLQAGGSSQVGVHAKQGPAWAVNASASSSSQPAITLVTSPTPSKQLSLDTTSAPSAAEESRPRTALSQRNFTHRRAPSGISLPASRTRSRTLSTISSWLPWPRPSDLSDNGHQDLTKAETRLREMLISNQGLGKGKAAVSVA